MHIICFTLPFRVLLIVSSGSLFSWKRLRTGHNSTVVKDLPENRLPEHTGDCSYEMDHYYYYHYHYYYIIMITFVTIITIIIIIMIIIIMLTVTACGKALR